MPMTQGELVRALLIEGAIGGAAVSAAAVLLSLLTRDLAGRLLLATLLTTAAGAYFGFAVAWQIGPRWTAVELAQSLTFAAVAFAGLRGSPWWLAAGWAVHPFWDLGHYLGPGHVFTPMAYAISCISFDLVVAASVGVFYTVRTRKRGPNF
jgi:hypothetical protein